MCGAEQLATTNETGLPFNSHSCSMRENIGLKASDFGSGAKLGAASNSTVCADVNLTLGADFY
jgi:hypothetical protein